MAAVVDSPNADAVMREAVDLVESLSTDLILLSVVDSDPMKTPSISAAIIELKTLHHRLISRYMNDEKLSKDSENPTEANYGYKVQGGKVRVESKVVQGNPIDKICESADLLQADLVILGTRGLGTLVLESVSDKVVQRLWQPVLIVKSQAPDKSNIDGRQRTPTGIKT